MEYTTRASGFLFVHKALSSFAFARPVLGICPGFLHADSTLLLCGMVDCECWRAVSYWLLSSTKAAHSQENAASHFFKILCSRNAPVFIAYFAAQVVVPLVVQGAPMAIAQTPFLSPMSIECIIFASGLLGFYTTLRTREIR